ncbi:endolytic transglycosylase MltG [Streptomyces sp. DT24]|uniref:endolytic transglycosylase MltG n=1 Tax=unclassified Streptomyces TaxID=2593676 RepID=UPI0023B93304|nr:endolytic transglycosylase MltG [Streptomyces sp. AM 4-1-1]WEH32494.1 endolytic transglycosylase MltG [Streptomyces sp. AM 4-1-1]
MTEYGRGPGSEPWHPEDPLYGDQGWAGQDAAHGQSQYGGQQQPYPQDPYAQQQPPPQPYQEQPGYGGGAPHDPYARQQHPQDPYQEQQPPRQQYGGGWDTGGERQDASTPYGGGPGDPYDRQPDGYGENHDPYRTPDAYPPPQPPGRREAASEQKPDWDPDAPQEEKHPFFTGTDERDDESAASDEPRPSRRGGRGGGERRGKPKKKGRNGCACLVVAVVLVGGLGGVGYVGYSYWQNKFGAAPDYTGTGTGEQVEIEIPKGSYGSDIGNILKKQGVVKSVDAFVSAQNENPKGKSIQAGVYLLHKEMSAANAVKMMVDPKSQNLLIIPEGTRNAVVYALIDKRLGAAAGTTAGVAKTNAGSLGLPAWADDDPKIKDRLEGFLYPAAYPVTKGMKPEAVLKKMVERSNEEYGKLGLEANAKRLNLAGPWQLITVASLVQAEGKTHDDFRKMAEVVYNRLKPTNTQTNQKLQFDSSFNYLKKQSNIKISESEVSTNPDSYNTYYHRGLTPGPIGNPGNEALAATLNPTTDGWLYFVATDGMHKTEFAKTYPEFLNLKEKFDALD